MMRRIREADDRDESIRKFDFCMEQLHTMTENFLDKFVRLKFNDEHKPNIISLAHNLYHDSRLVLNNLIDYHDLITHTLLDIRHEVHEKIFDDFSIYHDKLTGYLTKIIKANSLGIGTAFHNDERKVESNLLLKEFDEKIDAQFNENTALYFEGIKRNFQEIESLLFELKILKHGRTDTDYIDLYERVKSVYYHSDVWKRVETNYIKMLSQRGYDKDKILTKKLELSEELESDENLGNEWIAYSNDSPSLCKAILAKKFNSYTEINKMLSILGKLDLLDEWMEDMEYEEESYIPIDEDENRTVNCVEFVNDDIKKRFEEVWPQIYDYIMEEHDADFVWCCLHHTLSFYNNIRETSFKDFMLWLNDFSGKTLISNDNIRKVKNEYFVRTVKTIWNLDDLKIHLKKNKKRLTPQIESKYIKYGKICDKIREILLAH